MDDFFSLYKSIKEDAAVQELTEGGWAKTLGTAALAGSLVLGPMGMTVQAKPSVTSEESRIDMEKLLKAIKQVETSGGVDTSDRYEPNFEKTYLIKRYSKLGDRTKAAVDRYGSKKVATSYGPYQIMAATAYDLGFTGAPEDLRSELVSKQYVVKYINSLKNSGKTKSIEDVISAYNAGLGGIGTNYSYVSKVMKHLK